MQILTDNNVVIFYGNVEKGVYDADPSRELYKITNEYGEFYAVTEGFVLHEVDSLPNDFEDLGYCYTEKDGFYKNPNKPVPQPTVEELNAQIASMQEVLDFLLMQ